MPTLTSRLAWLTRSLNALSAAAVMAMMLLTCADIVLRLMRWPITGTYELMGFLAALFVSFALAQTSVDKGHIAVDFLVMRLSPRTQRIVDAVNDAVCIVLFAMVTWQCVIYAAELKASGEVSMTLQLPVFPVVYGIGAGCAVLCLVLAARVVDNLRN
ncbi:MAG: TRAP transporter small permease [Desulfobacterales bacterium]|jgi:TRAP-type C4-dicarboxylate transport system permease small subunit|nr:TRAP transporter small permease [Desulfobacteraceae bacterium]MDY0311616.1 TRAP transporter small permease [Desulfobacterales bacterium]